MAECRHAGKLGGHAHYHLRRKNLKRRYLTHFVKELGVNVVGGCCGTTPEHIRQLAKERRPMFSEGTEIRIRAECFEFVSIRTSEGR